LSPPRQTCTLTSSESNNNTINPLGPFSTSLNATKLLQFSPTQNAERIIVKITIAISDAVLIRSTSANSSRKNQSITTTINEQGV